MRPDVLLGLLTVGMAVLGGIVFALPPTNSLQKVGYVAAFIVLGTWAWVLVVKQAKQTAKSETELRNEIQRLAGESSEGTRLQGLNNQLQQQVLELTKLNTSFWRQRLGNGHEELLWPPSA